MKEVHGTFRKVDKDMDKVEDKIDENKRNINREKMFHQICFSSLCRVELFDLFRV